MRTVLENKCVEFVQKLADMYDAEDVQFLDEFWEDPSDFASGNFDDDVHLGTRLKLIELSQEAHKIFNP